jgi:hypothetical protein
MCVNDKKILQYGELFMNLTITVHNNKIIKKTQNQFTNSCVKVLININN